MHFVFCFLTLGSFLFGSASGDFKLTMQANTRCYKDIKLSAINKGAYCSITRLNQLVSRKYNSKIELIHLFTEIPLSYRVSCRLVVLIIRP